MKKELIANYIKEFDKTIIFENTYENNECIKIELVGWYFGKPDKDLIKEYANRDYICEF